MQKLLKLIEQIVPLLAFYPHWAQFVFFVTFALLLFSIFLFVVLYPSAATKRNQIMKNRELDLSLNLSVMTDYSEKAVSGYFDAMPSETLNYELAISDKRLSISPQMTYLQKLAEGGPVLGLDYWWSPFKWQFPNLDLKIVNNDKRTVYFTEAVFVITESSLDPWPILLIHENMYNVRHFYLVNEGWGEVLDCSINFNVISDDMPPDFNKQYKYKAVIGGFDETFNVDVSDALTGEGVDFSKLTEGRLAKAKYSEFRHVGTSYSASEDETVILLDNTGKEINVAEAEYYQESESEYEEKILRALGSFKTARARVVGEITYSGRTTMKTSQISKLKFSALVSLVEPGPGAPAPPSYQYEAMFEIGRTNYEVRVPISQVLQPGETDRFNILIGAPKSSHHAFKLKLIYNDGLALISPETMMKIFLPRSQAHAMRPAD